MNAYDVITDRIITQLEKGTAPWHKPWGSKESPANLVSQKAYRGINVWLTLASGYRSRYWLSYKQAADLGGHVKAGEKGTPVVFWKQLDIESQDPDSGETKHKAIPMIRYSTVFNIAQCELPESLLKKIQEHETVNPVNPIPACEAIADGMPSKPALEHGGDRACYSPSHDAVKMPAQESFDSSEEYYSTLFHELTHATGHESRCKREGITEEVHFGSARYSKEELIAEMGASYLSGTAGILERTVENSVAYCQSWIARLKGDSKLIVQAAAAAQKAADFILSK